MKDERKTKSIICELDNTIHPEHWYSSDHTPLMKIISSMNSSFLSRELTQKTL